MSVRLYQRASDEADADRLELFVHALADGGHHRSVLGASAHPGEVDLRPATDGRME
ncbi:MAG: hypothetical protein R2706_14915 [Acidimicrobiales bacterium]